MPHLPFWPPPLWQAGLRSSGKGQILSEPLPVRRAESLVVAQPALGGASEGAALLKALWM